MRRLLPIACFSCLVLGTVSLAAFVALWVTDDPVPAVADVEKPGGQTAEGVNDIPGIETVSLGTAKSGDVVEGTLSLRNDTDAEQPVTIETSCGCTTLSAPPTLAAGAAVDVPVSIVVPTASTRRRTVLVKGVVGDAVTRKLYEIDVQDFVPPQVVVGEPGHKDLVWPEVLTFGQFTKNTLGGRVTRRLEVARPDSRITVVDDALQIGGMKVSVIQDGGGALELVGDLDTADWGTPGLKRVFLHADVQEGEEVTRVVVPVVFYLLDPASVGPEPANRLE